MASPKTLVPFLFLVATLSFSSFCFQQATVEAKEFDIFVLALRRSAYICNQNKECCFANSCCRFKSPPPFTIHGFWPDYTNGTWPQCCSNTNFDESQVSALVPALVQFWPSLSCSPYTLCNGEQGLIWAQEWEYHGTCASPVLNDQYSYFSKAIELYLKYDVEEILNKAGYVGSNSVKYPLNSVVSTIKNAVGASPLLVCENGSLKQLRLCFQKDFMPSACGSVSSHSCPDYISLPTSGRSVHNGGNAGKAQLGNRKTFNPLIMA